MRLLSGDDQGMVTAEAAVAVLGLVAMLALAISALALAGLRLRCGDAARAGARVAARGEPEAAVVAAVHALLPGSVVRIETAGDTTRVTVVAAIPLTGSWSRGLPDSVSASAVALVESSTAPVGTAASTIRGPAP